MSSGGRVDVVVLTAIKVEYQEVRRHLVDLKTVPHQGTIFEIGTLRGSAARVALAILGAGNLTAAALTERALTEFKPKAILFVGIAGALRDDVALGDVVVGSRVYNYHSGVQTLDGFRPRTDSWKGAHDLEQLAQHLALAASWTESLPEPRRERVPAVHLAPIAAGEVLQDGNAAALRALYDDAAAVDMEDAGMLQAAHLSGNTKALAVRGISDFADGTKRTSDAAGWRETASMHAAAFAMALVASFHRVQEEIEARERLARRVTRRRVATVAAVLLVLLGTVASYTIRLGLVQFYEALGADLGELPIDVFDMVGPLLFVMIVVVCVAAITLVSFLAGAAALPWSEPTRAVMPATAIAAMLFLTAILSLTFVPDGWGRQLATMAMGMFFLGFAVRPSKQHARHTGGGVVVGLATTVGIVLLVGAVARGLPLPWPWPLVLFYAGVALATVALARWMHAEGRRGGGADPPPETPATTPLALIRRLWFEVMPTVRDFRGAEPMWRARRLVVGSFVIVTLMIAAGLWGVVSWIDGRGVAGRATLELGYVPFDHDSLALPTPVRPVTVTTRRSTDDPLAVCRRPVDRAASLLASAEDSYWVLLRPIGDSAASAMVVRLSSADYLVRLVPDDGLPNDGEPWARPACDVSR